MHNLSEYHGVWVISEHRDGILRGVTLELLSKGRELADTLSTDLTAVLLGADIGNQCQRLIAGGADKVILVDHPQLEHYQTGLYTDVVVQQVLRLKPEILLIGATGQGRDLAPRIARRLGTGLTADCTGLEIDRQTRLLVQTKPAYGGNLMASIITPSHRPQMSTVRPNIMTIMKEDPSRKAEVIKIPFLIEKKSALLKILEVVKEGKRSSSLEDADIIVAAGRGVGSSEKLGIIQELAETLGGEVGASRDIVDAGWISGSHLVGQTGLTVRPKLYIACGISGTVQHTAGMKNSETIVAINSNPRAAIFQIADYGIAGDLHQIVPLLTCKIKESL